MADGVLPHLLRALDVVVIERQPNHTFYPVTPAPTWFARAFGEAPVGAQHTLAGAFPFLDDFVQQALGAWTAGPHASIVSGPFAVDVSGEELLLRATALTVDGRTLLVLERLTGAADARPVLQRARERMLESETLTRRVETLHAPASLIGRTVGELAATALSAEQTRMVDDLRAASARLDDALAGMTPPAPRTRR